MGAFSSQKVVFGVGNVNVDQVNNDIRKYFEPKGYTVETELLGSGGAHISLTNSSIFKAVLGLKTALNVEYEPEGDNWHIKASVGIFGQQVIPTLIGLFVAWPVFLTQIWGLVKQSNLDDEVVNEIEKALQRYKLLSSSGVNAVSEQKGDFCTQCGSSIIATAKFCSQCGTNLTA